MWKYYGRSRPTFAEKTTGDEESVWDYPRPPKIERVFVDIIVKIDEIIISQSPEAFKVSETASPPTYYIKAENVSIANFVKHGGSSYCEWKGVATHWKLKSKSAVGVVGWSYDNPNEPYHYLKDCFAFYPAKLNCFLENERVRPQPGKFYGGWVTNNIKGPVKGAAGTEGW